MKPFLIGLGLCLQFVLCYSQGYSVCIPTWTTYPRSYSAGGTNEPSARQLQDCMARCERNRNCLAVDFRLNLEAHCWIHSEAFELNMYNFRPNGEENATQYRINRNCTDYAKGPECAPDWTQNGNVGSYYGEQVNYWTEYDCFTYCRYTDNCVGVDFNNKTSPPCWIHRSDVIPNNAPATGSEGVVVQYNLNKTCPSLDKSTSFRIGRCVGQNFPTTGWCPTPSATINITGAWFRLNPLCCYKNSGEAYPPDSLSLPSYIISYFDPGYFNEIKSFCGGQSVCNSSIRAKATGVASLNCADGQSGTNYVSIVYQCISDGSAISEEMTRRTTGGAMAESETVQTTKAGPSDIEQEARKDATNKENKNHLIIGLVVGLGVPLILAIIIVIIVFVRSRNKEQESEPKENPQMDNYFYNSETAPRGVVPENEHNEISMAVDSF